MVKHTAPDSQFVPRYFAIEQELRSRLKHLQPHDPLPSEAQLSAEFGVSRMTARAAVQRLVQDGLVYRETGRGTFVAPPVVDRQLSNLIGFYAEMCLKGLEPSSVLVSAGLRPCTDQQLADLELPPDSQVVSIERVRLANGVPMVFDRNGLPASLASVLETDLVSGSLHEALHRLGVHPSHGTSRVTAELASEADAKFLHIRPGSALLVERRIIRDPQGRPIEATESRYIPQHYTITAQFAVTEQAAAPPNI